MSTKYKYKTKENNVEGNDKNPHFLFVRNLFFSYNLE